MPFGMFEVYDWISIGGGAAGFFGALQYAEICKENNRPARVLILEASGEPLSKVKISGGGRCNITNHCFDPKKLSEFYPRGARELLSVFSRFQPKDTWEWFENRGVRLKIENDGRIFPMSDDSQTVINLFLSTAKKLNVDILLKSSISNFELGPDGRYLVHTLDSKTLSTRHLLVASGSSRKVWDILSRLGMKVVEPVASLFSFNIADARLEGLSGRSFQDVEIECKVGKEKYSARGPLLITHWGLSGPAILKLSAWAARELAECDYRTTLVLNFLPTGHRQELIEIFRRLRSKDGGSKIKNYGLKGMNTSYWVRILEKLGLGESKMWSEISNHQIDSLVNEILSAKFETQGKTTNKDEFVTAGGVSLKEIDFKTMQSKKFSNLYFAGEVLDIDGVTGGFNFQSAWSTSTLAARAAAEKSESPGDV